MWYRVAKKKTKQKPQHEPKMLINKYGIPNEIATAKNTGKDLVCSMSVGSSVQFFGHQLSNAPKRL